MTRPTYAIPSRRERDLAGHLAQAQARLGELMADCTGRATIENLERKVAALEMEACALRKVKVDNLDLRDKNKKLKELASCHKKENASLKWDVKVAHSYGIELERKLKRESQRRYEWATFARDCVGTIRELRAESKYLQAKLNRDSDNSSIPPSACPNRKRISNSRTSSGRRPGGQPGHAGHKRQRRACDETVILAPDQACPNCGGPLVVRGNPRVRQLHDLVISVKTTDFVAHDYTCACCKKRIGAAFPEGVENEVNFGNDIRSAVTYLTNRCNVSIDNAIGFIHEATNHELKVSKGSAHNFSKLFSKRARPDLDDIAALIGASPVVGSDATCTSTKGKRTYIYTFNSDAGVIYQASAHKGISPLIASPIANYNGLLIHDHDKSYYRFGSAHAECNVHILRYLKGVCENEPDKTWAPLMLALLKAANAATRSARENKEDELGLDMIASIERQYDAILESARCEYLADEPFNPKYKPDGIALFSRLKEYRANHLAFLHDLSIPFDNNASERLLRGAKKKMKQSGGFRSIATGQAYYCDFLSIIQTASMKDMEVMGVVRDIFNNKGGMFRKPIANDPPTDP